MRRYVNLDTLQLQERPDFAVPVTSMPVKFSKGNTLEFQFVRSGGTVELLPPGTVITYGIKLASQYDGDFVTSGETSTRPSDVTGFYAISIPAETDAIKALLAANGSTTDDQSEQTIHGAISWQIPGQDPEETEGFSVELENAIVRGDEGATSPANPARLQYRPDITALTGSSSALDHVATVGVALGFVVEIIIGGVMSQYQLVTGAANAGAGEIAPQDFNSVSNNKKWTPLGVIPLGVVLHDLQSLASVDAGGRQLVDGNGSPVLAWSNSSLQIDDNTDLSQLNWILDHNGYLSLNGVAQMAGIQALPGYTGILIDDNTDLSQVSWGIDHTGAANFQTVSAGVVNGAALNMGDGALSFQSSVSGSNVLVSGNDWSFQGQGVGGISSLVVGFDQNVVINSNGVSANGDPITLQGNHLDADGAALLATKVVSQSNANSSYTAPTSSHTTVYFSGSNGATFTLNLPAAPTPGQIVRMVCSASISHLTVAAASGGFTDTPPTSLAVGGFLAYQFVQNEGGFYRWARIS